MKETSERAVKILHEREGKGVLRKIVAVKQSVAITYAAAFMVMDDIIQSEKQKVLSREKFEQIREKRVLGICGVEVAFRHDEVDEFASQRIGGSFQNFKLMTFYVQFQ